MQTARYIDIKALSDHLQIKTSTLYAWTARNKIPSIKIHGVIRFQMDEINTWLEGFRNKQPEKPSISLKEKKTDIDTIIARAKREVYNRQGETRPKSTQRKEKKYGAV